MRKKLMILGFALAAAAASTFTFTSTAAAGPAICPGTGYYVVTCADGIHHICCPDNATCAC